MILKVLGSSSAGNCYILQSKTEILIIEAGVKITEVKDAIEYDVSKVVGCIISHEHGDHAKYAKDFIKAGIDIYASKGTLDRIALNQKMLLAHHLQPVQEKQEHKIGDFKIIPFHVIHDSADAYGYLVYHYEMGWMLFVTDTYYLPYKFDKEFSIMLVEANYDKDLMQQNLDNSTIPYLVANRTRRSHMELQTCKDVIMMNNYSKCNNIVLIHLSGANANAKQFKDYIEGKTGKKTTIAEKGVEMNIDINPF